MEPNGDGLQTAPRWRNRFALLQVYPYEQLQESLDDIARRCGFPPEPLTVKEKSGWRETITVTAAQRKRIMEAFGKSNALMGYA